METLETEWLKEHAQIPMQYVCLMENVKVRIIHLKTNERTSLIQCITLEPTQIGFTLRYSV